MKKLILALFAVGAFTLGAQAQKAACCAGKKAASTSSSAAACTKVDQATLDKAAAADASIVRQVSNDGQVSYARKVVNKNGEVEYTPVEYCTKSGKFINMAPGEAEHCTKAAGEASATTTADGKAKACCANGEKKACCANGKKASATKVAAPSKAKTASEANNQ